ncbi:hypothetical protein E2C01_083008 [Portunus trituberculatus]|uniref:Uncharacterized protein n=1 Tax=Portunus trituberculatus TaxID=210409 RepID=A0A5B7IZZ7_PORTR|nr:hypothetical protein [Portunus trituberculatus]
MMPGPELASVLVSHPSPPPNLLIRKEQFEGKREYETLPVNLTIGPPSGYKLATLFNSFQTNRYTHYAACHLCHAPQANTIEHYCLACPTVRHLLPQGLPLDAVCRHLLPHDVLDELLVRFPRFGGFS